MRDPETLQDMDDREAERVAKEDALLAACVDLALRALDVDKRASDAIEGKAVKPARTRRRWRRCRQCGSRRVLAGYSRCADCGSLLTKRGA